MLKEIIYINHTWLVLYRSCKEYDQRQPNKTKAENPSDEHGASSNPSITRIGLFSREEKSEGEFGLIEKISLSTENDSDICLSKLVNNHWPIHSTSRTKQTGTQIKQ